MKYVTWFFAALALSMAHALFDDMASASAWWQLPQGAVCYMSRLVTSHTLTWHDRTGRARR